LIENLVAEAVDGRAGRTAIDLYAGAGLFAIQLAKRFNRIVGVESDRCAAEFARQNAKENGVTNLEIVTANAESWLGPYLKSRASAIDLVLLDPPRGGASQVAAALAETPSPKVVYVSCDPVTLARDLKKLLGGGYQIEDIIAFDLFPQTYHVETVVKLTQSMDNSGAAS
jgi:23S rRNA (uracil1939-C5)-methyltransferase